MDTVKLSITPPPAYDPALGPKGAENLALADAAAKQGEAQVAERARQHAAAHGLPDPTAPTTKAPEANPDGTIKSKKILGKFDTQADLEKAYAELEAKQATGPKGKTDEGTPLVTQDELAAFAKAVTDSGDLSAEQYAALAKKGLGRELVKGYVDGLKARGAEAIKATYDMAGGEDGYKAMSAWASANVPQEQLEVFNADVRSGDRARLATAVTGLYGRYLASTGARAPAPAATAQQQPQRQAGSQQGLGGVRPIGSMEELTALQGSPQYKFDPAFRNEVIRRLSASNI